MEFLLFIWLLVISYVVYNIEFKTKKLEKTIEELYDKIYFLKKELLQDKNSTIQKEATVDEVAYEATKVKEQIDKPIQKRVEQKATKETQHTQRVIEEQISTLTKTKESVKTTKEKSQQDENAFVKFLTNYFTGGNILVRIGGVVLFFGLSFLIQYIAINSTISIEIKLAAVALFGIVLTAIGWRLKEKEGSYGQILQGVGVATLYLVIYSASKFYSLLSLDIAFTLMFTVVVIGSILASIQKSLPLAIFSIVGGFLVPILTSTNNGSHILLFGYYVLLNIGIFILSLKHSWRILNAIGFIFTFAIATTWGVLRYESTFFNTTEPFLIIFFIIYLAISIIFTKRYNHEPKNYVDALLVFGLPMVAFGLQLKLVENFKYGAAISAIVLSALYFMLYNLLNKNEKTNLLAQSFGVLSLIFFTISIPYTFGAKLSTILLTIEATGVIWLSIKQNKLYTRLIAQILLVGSAIYYTLYNALHYDTVTPLINSIFLGFIIIISALIFTAYYIDKNLNLVSKYEKMLPIALLILAAAIYYIASVFDSFNYAFKSINILIIYILTAHLILVAIGKKLEWKLLQEMLQATPIATILLYLTTIAIYRVNLFEELGILTFVAIATISYATLYIFDKNWKFKEAIHTMLYWFIAFALSYQTFYYAEKILNDKAVIITVTILPILVLTWFTFILNKLNIKNELKELYFTTIAGGLITILALWEVVALFIITKNYTPIINILDFTQIVVLFTIAYYIHQAKIEFKKELYGAIGLFLMLLISAIYARIVTLSGVDYKFTELFNNGLFQSGISIIWSIMAIILMLISKKIHNRELWIFGFATLVAVVVKLLVIDMSNVGTIERIISFIVVGLLLLLIGYFVPLPPADTKKIK